MKNDEKSGCAVALLFLIIMTPSMILFFIFKGCKDIDTGLVEWNDPPVRYVKINQQIYDKVKVSYRQYNDKRIQSFYKDGCTIVVSENRLIILRLGKIIKIIPIKEIYEDVKESLRYKYKNTIDGFDGTANQKYLTFDKGEVIIVVNRIRIYFMFYSMKDVDILNLEVYVKKDLH